MKLLNTQGATGRRRPQSAAVDFAADLHPDVASAMGLPEHDRRVHREAARLGRDAVAEWRTGRSPHALIHDRLRGLRRDANAFRAAGQQVNISEVQQMIRNAAKTGRRGVRLATALRKIEAARRYW
jgi:hypothetical protein